MAVSPTDSGVSKREWQKPEIAALKVDLRAVAQGNGITFDSRKADTADPS